MSSGNDGIIRFGCDFERDEFKLRNLRAEAFSQLGRGLSADSNTRIDSQMQYGNRLRFS